ncbi:ABC transporter related protein [Rhodobacter sp. NSM]|uniref:ABC transporter related protein n=1 Tax=Rhodobacter sp. NSM TaxID=3457501 RepID=UPI003FD065F1
MSSLITVSIALPSRTAWAALRYADRWLGDRIEPEEGQFFVTATAAELAADGELRSHFAQLVATAPGLCLRLEEELRRRPLQPFDVLQLLFLHDGEATVDRQDAAEDARRADALLAGAAP